jgi:hypothetical protein
VLFAAEAPHQPSRSAARALKSMACGKRRCGRRGSGGAAWARYLLAAASFRRAGSAAGQRGRPGGGSALGRRTDTNKQTHEQTNRFAPAPLTCLRCCASRRRHWSASVRFGTQTHASTHARMRTDTRIHTHADTRAHARTQTHRHEYTHAHTRTRTHSHSHLHTLTLTFKHAPTSRTQPHTRIHTVEVSMRH